MRLSKAWNSRLKLYVKGKELSAKANKLYDESDEFHIGTISYGPKAVSCGVRVVGYGPKPISYMPKVIYCGLMQF